MRPTGRVMPPLVLGASLVLLAPPLLAQEHYAGKTVTMIVGFGPGGGYDIWARAVADHLGKHLPGNPQIIVENLPGAGTLRATNQIANLAPRDGTVIGVVGRDVFLEPILGNEAAQFDPTELTFLGSAATETNVCFAHQSSGVRTAADLLETPLIVGALAPGNGTYNYPKALSEIYGFRFEIIHGYESGTAINYAMEQGEVAGICQSYDGVATRYPQWIEDGTVALLFQGGVEPDPELAEVPFILDLAETDEQRELTRFLYAGQFFGRPFIAPPLEEEVADMLRDAFDALSTDAEFLAQMDAMGLVFAPVPGRALQAFVEELAQTPQETIDYIVEITR